MNKGRREGKGRTEQAHIVFLALLFRTVTNNGRRMSSVTAAGFCATLKSVDNEFTKR